MSKLFPLILGACLAAAAPDLIRGESEKSEASKPTGSSQARAASSAPPAPHNIRLEENWREPAPGPPLKHIPLDSDGSIVLSLGGQLRWRSEIWDNFGFQDNPAGEDAFSLLRLRLHADLYLGKHLRVFLEPRSGLAAGRSLPGGFRTLDVDSLDLQHLVVEVSGQAGEEGTLALRLGRQELQFGRQRLVSPLDWANVRRTFDGARLVLRRQDLRVDGFWVRPVRVQKYRFNSSHADEHFFGLYGTAQAGSDWTVDAYWLGLDRDEARPGSPLRPETRHTLGTRLAVKRAPVDFEVEPALQLGRATQQEIRAWMVAVDTGVAFQAGRVPARAGAGLDLASGDESAKDGRFATFHPLFPLGHPYLGQIDAIGRQNVADLSFNLGATLTSRLKLRVEYHNFWRLEASDAVYNAGGGIVFPGGTGPLRFLGNEIDVTVSVTLLRGGVLGGGLSRFFVASVPRAENPSDMTFAHVGYQLTF